MQRFMRRPGPPVELFVWTEELAKQSGFEEVWANDAKDAASAPAAALLDSVGRSDLKFMSKRELACWAAFRLSLELDPERKDKAEIIAAICKKQDWELPDLSEGTPPDAAKPADPGVRVLPNDNREVVEAIVGAANVVANAGVKDGAAAVVMMISGGFVPADPFAVAQEIDNKALEILSNKAKSQSGDAGAGQRSDSTAAG